MNSTRRVASWASPWAWLVLGDLLLLAGCPRAAHPPTEPTQHTATSVPTAASPSLVPGHVDVAGAARLLAGSKDAVPIDVRTPAEFSGGHIPGATNIDFASEGFASELAKLDRSKTYVVHCAAGGRSTQSLAVFARLGFKSVIHLDGGLSGWIAAGQPIDH